MSQVAQVRPGVLSENANTVICSTLRRNILAVMEGPLFTRYERVRTKLNLVQCTDAAQLQRYYAGVQKARKTRETACQWAAEEGDYTTGLDSADEASTDEASDMSSWYDECDKDAA